jgi:hypothetical protein
VFFRRIDVLLVLQQLEGFDQAGPGKAGVDDIIEVPAGGRYIGVGKLSGIFLDQLLSHAVGVH